MRTLLFAISILALAAPGVLAQSASHVVTINVIEVNSVSVSGPVTLDIITFDPVTGIGTDTDNSSTLSWMTNAAVNKEVTVSSTALTTVYGLTVVAGAITPAPGSVTPGAGAGLVDLQALGGVGTAAVFIAGINKGGGSCPLNYTATATIADDPGTEAHTVTYTIQDESLAP